MSDSTKMIVYLITGGLLTLFYKLNKNKIDQETKDLIKLKNQKSIPASQLKDQFSITNNDTHLQLFVEGNVQQNSKLLKSVDKTANAVFKRITTYNNEIWEQNSKVQKQTIKIGESKKFADSFRLQSHGNTDTSQLVVYNFSETVILPKILKSKKKDKIFSSPEIRTVIRQPKNDKEKVEFNQGKIKKFLTTISKIGVTVEEEVLIEGTFLCLYGEVVKDKASNTFTVTAPQYFGVSKDQIIKYLEAGQVYKKIRGILLAIGGATFLILGIHYSYKIIDKFVKSLKEKEKTKK